MDKIAIVVEDQPVIWDYARLCLKDRAHIAEFCATTEEAEETAKASLAGGEEEEE